ncbi:hypothetical protein DINM_006699 [Dirofilaria immitis]|nr:hypothetical protein [Dirofilaria immitis]
MPSVITFDSDDSLLSILRTPTPKSVRRNIRRKKLIHVPDSPVCSKPKKSPIDSYVPFRFDPDDEAYRKQQLRHVHKMLKIRNQYDRNRANIAKSSFSKHYHLLLPTVQCHQNNSDEESEADEYFEDELFESNSILVCGGLVTKDLAFPSAQKKTTSQSAILNIGSPDM